MTTVRPLRICFIGDSFVNGTGDPTCLGWTGRLCADACNRGHEVTYYNLGVRRETSFDIKQRWYHEVQCRLSDRTCGRLVFSFGTNDTTLESKTLRVDVQHSVQNTIAILEVAKNLFPTLMVSPPPTSDREQNLRTAYLSRQFENVCHTLEIPYLDVFRPLQQSSIWMKEVAQFDGSHPSTAGYLELAHLVQKWSAWLEWVAPV